MYILKNSLISIIRSKGRNILIGIIILVISASCTVTLAIRNTAEKLVKNYEESNEVIATISFNRQNLSKDFKGGEDAMKENIEAFNNIESFTIDDVKNYGDSQYLKSFYYVYSTSLNSDTLTKASDKFEYEVENRETSTSTSTTTSESGASARPNMPEGGMPEGGTNTHTTTNTTTVITKTKEVFQNNRDLSNDFELDGYSSYEAMTDFISGNYKITSGNMFTDFTANECVINEELATLNEISVGDTITFKNPNNEKTYELTVVGIYKDSSNQDDSKNMYSNSANKIIVGSSVVESIVQDDETLTTNITPSFILNDKNVIEDFTNEVKEKGLNDYYTINTNLEELESATKSIENVKTFATTFLIIALIIATVVLFVINMINIRERKYEIGVYRTIGIGKFKLTMQFVLELLIVTVIFLSIGGIIGGFISKDVGNKLLASQIEESNSSQEQVAENFGRPDMKGDMEMPNYNGNVKAETIDSIDAVVDYVVILELLGIGIGLTLISSLASMISIQRFSPLTILKERS